MQDNKRIKVSVCVVTYNHEKYIRQCLQSLVDQITEFDFEIIVGEDSSTDKTRQIINEFVENYPNLVRAVLHEKNVGPTKNYFSVHNLAKGEYVAHLDGDDYALPGKLTALSRHLDSNPDCSIVWHRMYILNEKGQSTIGMPLKTIENITGKTKLYARDLALYYGITGCHSGSMYRRAAKNIASAKGEMLDYYFTLSMCTRGGCAMYIDECFGVYRFFADEQTITRAKGGTLTGRAKLMLIGDYIRDYPELRKAFAAQSFFEMALRIYLRHPLKLEFFKMWFHCGLIFSLRDLHTVVKIFMNNRNSKLRESFIRHGALIK